MTSPDSRASSSSAGAAAAAAAPPAAASGAAADGDGDGDRGATSSSGPRHTNGRGVEPLAAASDAAGGTTEAGGGNARDATSGPAAVEPPESRKPNKAKYDHVVSLECQLEEQVAVVAEVRSVTSLMVLECSLWASVCRCGRDMDNEYCLSVHVHDRRSLDVTVCHSRLASPSPLGNQLLGAPDLSRCSHSVHSFRVAHNARARGGGVAANRQWTRWAHNLLFSLRRSTLDMLPYHSSCGPSSS
jgi:hypothetical protein